MRRNRLQRVPDSFCSPWARCQPSHRAPAGAHQPWLAELPWDCSGKPLLWYFTTLSVVGVVYGSLATTIVGLLSLEVASIFLLLGTQVTAELRACRRRRHGGTRRTQDGGRTRRTAVTRQQILVDSHAPIRSGLVIVVNARLVGTVTPSGGVGERERGRALQLFPCQTHHVASLARVVL